MPFKRKKTCNRCGEEFIRGRSDTKYCSNKCRQAAWDNRHKSTKKTHSERSELMDASGFSKMRDIIRDNGKMGSYLIMPEFAKKYPTITKEILKTIRMHADSFKNILSSLSNCYISKKLIHLAIDEARVLSLQIGQFGDNQIHLNNLDNILLEIYHEASFDEHQVLVSEKLVNEMLYHIGQVRVPDRV